MFYYHQKYFYLICNICLYFFVFFSLLFCSNALKIQYDIIPTVSQLSIQKITTPFNGHLIKFYAFNEEINFAGYRFYQDTSMEFAIQQQQLEFKKNRTFTPKNNINNISTGWCILQKQVELNQQIQVQVEFGAINRNDNYHCLISNLNLVSNRLLAIRAGVNRDCSVTNSMECFPWSIANGIKIP